eukprot:1158424-Pelagomonas_calceolata.AAC.5
MADHIGKKKKKRTETERHGVASYTCDGLTSRVANNHATKDGYTRAVGLSCECTGLALLHVAAKLLLVLLNSAGLAAARR